MSADSKDQGGTVCRELASIARELQEDGKHQQYAGWFADVAFDRTKITGPHMGDRQAIYWPITVLPKACNRHGTLHGGVAAKLIDTFSSLHLGAVAGRGLGAVSVSLAVNFLRPVPKGAAVVIKTYVVRCGRKLAFLEAVVAEARAGGVIYMTATHTKAFVRDSKL